MDSTVEPTRYRVNVAISTKGVITWDCTVDSNSLSKQEVLNESDILVAQLKERYPVVMG